MSGLPLLHRWVLVAMVGYLCALGAPAAASRINEDYKQLDARGASDFDILLEGDVAGQITGGGQSHVTNPFADPTRTTSHDAYGNTIVRFAGSDTIPADRNANRHFGIFGTGKKPRVLVKAWSFTTAPHRVPVPKSNFDFAYQAESQTLTITVENTSPHTVTFDQVGYFLSAVEYPIEELTRESLPPEAFEPIDDLNGEYAPGDARTFEISGVDPSSYALSYATVFFSGPSADNAYDATGGEWAQVDVASQAVANQPVDDVDAEPAHTKPIHP